MQPSILIINGPNLNMLGSREPETYGAASLADIEASCVELANALEMSAVCIQSNHEGELIDSIQAAAGLHQGIIINAGAYTHTSVAIHDALKMLDIPIIELHISNVFTREAFRHASFISPVATAVMCGFGAQGYALALQGIKGLLE